MQTGVAEDAPVVEQYFGINPFRLILLEGATVAPLLDNCAVKLIERRTIEREKRLATAMAEVIWKLRIILLQVAFGDIDGEPQK